MQPRSPRGKAAKDAALPGENPFERALQNEFQTLPKSERRLVIELHDDLHIARAIAQSIFGRAWAEHIETVYRLLIEGRNASGGDR